MNSWGTIDHFRISRRVGSADTANSIAATAKQRAGRRNRRVYYWSALAVLFIAYLIQLPSPLRLNTGRGFDPQANRTAPHNKPYLQDGARPVYPDRRAPDVFVDGAPPASPTASDLAFLISPAFVSPLIALDHLHGHRPAQAASLIILASFANFVLIKHALLPLTDILYMAASLACVALLENLDAQCGSKRILALILGLLLLTVAMLFRRVGIALLPAAAFRTMAFSQRARVDQGIFCNAKNSADGNCVPFFPVRCRSHANFAQQRFMRLI